MAPSTLGIDVVPIEATLAIAMSESNSVASGGSVGSGIGRVGRVQGHPLGHGLVHELGPGWGSTRHLQHCGLPN